MAARRFYESVSRAADVVAAGVGLVLFAPVLALVAAAVALDSGTPVLYRGVRVGRGGRRFRIVKFRTMVRGADRLGSSVTRADDARVTRLGPFLRRSKLDELPQLWNVWTGDMSLIGPRPDAPEIVETYTGKMRRALEVRPGVTSVASLWLRNESELLRDVDAPDEVYEKVIVPAKVDLALAHVRRRSLVFDWGVLFATVGAWWGLRRPSRAEREFLESLRGRVVSYAKRGGAEASESAGESRA